MKQTTIDTLNQVNQTFYSKKATSFSQTRNHSWPAFDKSWQMIKTDLNDNPTIVDIGCGNGRYVSFLNTQIDQGSYIGIDSSAELIDEARKIESKLSARFIVHDILTSELPLENNQADVVVCWGVMHHIPGFETRKAFLNKLSELLKPGGFLIVSFWQFLYYERFKKKIVSPLPPELHLKQEDLEPNDVLLSWNSPDDYRYCHHFDTEEINQYSDLPSLTQYASFKSDGNLDQFNYCVVWKKQ